MVYPCDRHLRGADDAYFRAVSVAAPADVLFRWLCQLRVAPYSYDWIDNLGRTSPRTRTPALEHLAVGDVFMTIFELVEFERDRHVTLRSRWDAEPAGTEPFLRLSGALFPAIAVSYVIADAGRRVRLLMKIVARRPPGLRGRLQRALLPWGDLVMARRQLSNLRDLAEAEARRPPRAGTA
jgi:hypothetical protein